MVAVTPENICCNRILFIDNSSRLSHVGLSSLQASRPKYPFCYYPGLILCAAKPQPIRGTIVQPRASADPWTMNYSLDDMQRHITCMIFLPMILLYPTVCLLYPNYLLDMVSIIREEIASVMLRRRGAGIQGWRSRLLTSAGCRYFCGG